MKVLVLSAEVWRDDKNGGNVLSNIFEGLDAEFAQVYCNPGEPDNFLCKRYYQMTDGMVVRNILKREKICIRIFLQCIGFTLQISILPITG